MAKVNPIGQSTPVKMKRESITSYPDMGILTKLKNPKQCFESEDEDEGGDSSGKEIAKVIPVKGKIRYKNRPVTPKKLFNCDECGKSWQSRFYIKVHNRNVHSGEKLLAYPCSDCKKSFKTLSILGVHKRVHSEEKPFSCDQCEKSFKVEQYVKEHKIRCHVVRDPKYVTKIYDESNSTSKFHCEECGKSSTTKWSLIVHQRTHTDERPFSCDECDKSFTVKCNLQNHKRRHLDERPFSCNSCDQTFQTTVNLYNHKWRTVKGVRHAKCV